MRIAVGSSVLIVALLVVTTQADDEKEKKIGVSECPRAVQKTLKKEIGKGKVIDVDVRKIDEVAVYESEVRLGDLEYDIVIRGDGTLLSKHLENDGDEDAIDAADEGRGDAGHDGKGVEKSVRMSDLPKRIARILKRESRGGEIEEIEMEVEGDRVVFEAEVEFGDKEYEIQIAGNGTLLSKVLEEDEGDATNDEHDDDEHEHEHDEDDGEEDDA